MFIRCVMPVVVSLSLVGAPAAQAADYYGAPAPMRPYAAPRVPPRPPSPPRADSDDSSGWTVLGIVGAIGVCAWLGCFSGSGSSGGGSSSSGGGGGTLQRIPNYSPPADGGDAWSKVPPIGPLYGDGPGGSFYGH